MRPGTGKAHTAANAWKAISELSALLLANARTTVVAIKQLVSATATKMQLEASILERRAMSVLQVTSEMVASAPTSCTRESRKT